MASAGDAKSTGRAAEARNDVIGTLAGTYPDARFVLIDEHVRDVRTTSAFSPPEHREALVAVDAIHLDYPPEQTGPAANGPGPDPGSPSLYRATPRSPRRTGVNLTLSAE